MEAEGEVRGAEVGCDPMLSPGSEEKKNPKRVRHADLLKGMDVSGGQRGEGGGQRRQGRLQTQAVRAPAPEKERVEGGSCSALVPTGRGLTGEPAGSGASVQTPRGSSGG